MALYSNLDGCQCKHLGRKKSGISEQGLDTKLYVGVGSMFSTIGSKLKNAGRQTPSP